MRDSAPSGLLSDRFFPALDSAQKRLGIPVAPSPEVFHRTGGSSLVRSGSVEDELLVAGKRRKLLVQLAEGDRAGDADRAASLLVVVGADQDGGIGPSLMIAHPGDGNAVCFADHGSSPSAGEERGGDAPP